LYLKITFNSDRKGDASVTFRILESWLPRPGFRPHKDGLPIYVHTVKNKGRLYYYFRKGNVRIKLPGRPNSREFRSANDRALALVESD
jgi:hypothetical protein